MSSVDPTPVSMKNASICSLPQPTLRQQSAWPTRVINNEKHAQMTKKMVLLRGAPDILQVRKPDLRDDSAELPARGRDSVRGGPVARRERLAGDDESRRVRPEVREEVREAVQEHERIRAGRRRLHRVERGAYQSYPDEFVKTAFSTESESAEAHP